MAYFNVVMRIDCAIGNLNFFSFLFFPSQARNIPLEPDRRQGSQMLRYSNAKINQSQSNNQTYSEEVSDDGIKTLTLTLSYGPYSLYNKSYQHHNINTYTAATAQQQHARFHFLSPSAQISNLKFSMLLFITVVTNELHTNKSKLKTSLSQLNFYISSYFELNTWN